MIWPWLKIPAKAANLIAFDAAQARKITHTVNYVEPLELALRRIKGAASAGAEELTLTATDFHFAFSKENELVEQLRALGFQCTLSQLTQGMFTLHISWFSVERNCNDCTRYRLL